MQELNIAITKFSLLDNLPIGLCLLRQDFVVLFWNRCLENWTKISRTEILGRNLCDHFTQLNQPKYQLRFQQVFQFGFPAIFSSQLHQSLIPSLLPNGEERIQKTTVNAIPTDDGNGFYALVVLEDITELKKRLKIYQQELTQRKKTQAELERSNAELEQFAYLASHDLQEPLRMVISFTQLLARRYQGQLDADADRIIGFAVDGAKRMEALIKDMLTYSRLAIQGKPFEYSNCEEVLDLTLKNLQLLIQETGTSIYRNPLPTLPADKSQLVQLFQNLFSNAIKYHSDKPPEIEIGAEAQNGQWLFYVKDNGIGIKSQYFKRIFAIFQRLHTRQKYPGTGIGLALCQKIVNRHGGKIWVESEPGQGSTFYFTIRVIETR
ncbi:MAG: ATP-binding protein [Xenococcaceae cyanobacterium MO_167.B27]|nr:ATP-binding protein [Xenococcaceae cyanobacterium MO_167.B27]